MFCLMMLGSPLKMPIMNSPTREKREIDTSDISVKLDNQSFLTASSLRPSATGQVVEEPVPLLPLHGAMALKETKKIKEGRGTKEG